MGWLMNYVEEWTPLNAKDYVLTAFLADMTDKYSGNAVSLIEIPKGARSFREP
jgi:hypothetical protein